jgi:type III pantothenate kinase
MLCVVDIGNTNIVVALMESCEKVCFSGRIITERDKKKEKFMQEIDKLFCNSHYKLENVDGVIISSVVPEITEKIREGMYELTGKEVKVLGPELDTGLIINMDNPEKVGSDLIAVGVAATEMYSGTVVIFDMGTATTCSVVRDKEYLGTLIMAGVGISQEALSSRASQLPQISLEDVEDGEARLLAKNTVDSMIGGIVYGNASMIDGIIQRIEDEMQCKVTALATGGIAKLIVPYCKKKVILDENLLLKGMWYINA